MRGPQTNRAQERAPSRTGGVNHWTPEEMALVTTTLDSLVALLPGRTALAVSRRIEKIVQARADSGVEA